MAKESDMSASNSENEDIFQRQNNDNISGTVEQQLLDNIDDSSVLPQEEANRLASQESNVIDTETRPESINEGEGGDYSQDRGEITSSQLEDLDDQDQEEILLEYPPAEEIEPENVEIDQEKIDDDISLASEPNSVIDKKMPLGKIPVTMLTFWQLI